MKVEIDPNVFGLGQSNAGSTELKLKRALERSEFKVGTVDGDVNQHSPIRANALPNQIPDGCGLELIERKLLFLGADHLIDQTELPIDNLAGAMFEKVGQSASVNQNNEGVRLNTVSNSANRTDLLFQNAAANARSKTVPVLGLLEESGVKLTGTPYGPSNMYIVERGGVKTLFVRDYKNDSLDVEAIRELLREHGVEPDRIIVNGREY